MAKHYENIRKVTLSDYIPADSFRTVMPPQWEGSAGYSELPVAITIKKTAAAKLSFNIPWDGMVYGFVRNKFDLKEKLGMKEVPLSAVLNDWDGHFLLVFESGDRADTRTFEVVEKEVIDLLENCRRVPEQKSVR